MNSFTPIQRASVIRNTIKNIPKQGGVYKQYVDDEGLKFLDGVHPSTKELVNNQNVHLIYIGRTKDLRDRLKSHLGLTNVSHGSITRGFISTLRVSYMANHSEITSLSEQDKLNRFLDKHIYIQYMVTDDFVAVEEQLINDNDLPLNIQGNNYTFVQTNKARRKEIKELYKKENP